MATKRLRSTGGGSMAKIIDRIREKINSNPTLYIFIIFSELTYLMLLSGMWFVFALDRNHPLNILGILLPVGFLSFLFVHTIYIISGFCNTENKKIKIYVVKIFLLKLFLFLVTIALWFHTA